MFHRTDPKKINAEKLEETLDTLKLIEKKVDSMPSKKQFAVMAFCIAIVVPPVTLGIITSFNESARNSFYEMLGISQTEKPEQSAPALKH